MAPVVDAPVAPGDVVAGQYRIDSVLGEGAMGVVYAATRSSDDGEVAIKVLHPRHLRGEGRHLERFVREAKVAGKLDSPHAVRVLDVGMLAGENPYFVMERLHGVDLLRHLKQVGTLSVPRAAELLLQACDAISEAHRLGIVHRDLKLANLFLARSADGQERLKVIDFGVSKLLRPIDEDGQATATTVVVGTPAFMAPEQMRSSKVDARVDVWALGVTLFWLVTGRRPFEGESIVKIYESILKGPPPIAELVPGVPDGLETLVKKALTWDPDERLASVDAFADELRAFADAGVLGDQPASSKQAVLATVEGAPAFVATMAMAPSSDMATAVLDPALVADHVPASTPWRASAKRASVFMAALALLMGAYALGTTQGSASASAQLFAPGLLRDLPAFAVSAPPPEEPRAEAAAPPPPAAEASALIRPVPRVVPAPPPGKLAPPKRPKSRDEVWGMP
jgi:eukaryotic-like serine/threonine-protein kinase